MPTLYRYQFKFHIFIKTTYTGEIFFTIFHKFPFDMYMFKYQAKSSSITARDLSPKGFCFYLIQYKNTNLSITRFLLFYLEILLSQYQFLFQFPHQNQHRILFKHQSVPVSSCTPFIGSETMPHSAHFVFVQQYEMLAKYYLEFYVFHDVLLGMQELYNIFFNCSRDPRFLAQVIMKKGSITQLLRYSRNFI